MDRDSDTREADRILLALLAGITGAGYGVLIWSVAFFFTDQPHPNIIVWSVVVFACVGFFYGNFAIEAFLALIHFLWGALNGLTENVQFIEESNAKKHLRAFLLVGFCTGLVLALWLYF